ncbi:XRE family transcriptional regulator [Aquirufa nivalisilvae]|uniref:XRE family transcriptional regulator n=1 Tax=Aquirufa nivalisilvae TaxID=2516557 RepID=UPI0022A8D9B9|nr:helix-turn-helix domain-containing protein [Aquirufa nivalisilvae]MCZ2480052.1 helix-turn-helix transcriptional regulator [Aquirufa nivalisilvae]
MVNNKTVGERIAELLIQNGLSRYQLSKMTGLSEPGIGKIILKNSKPNRSTIIKIADALKVNSDWLLTGEGSMKSIAVAGANGVLSKKQEVKQVDSSKFMEVPYVSAIAQAGFMNGHFYNHLEELDTMLLPQEFEKGNYIVVEIVGESMNDGTDKSINDGDKLLLKEVEMPLNGHGLNFRQNIFVIVSHEGIVCKQITKHDVEKGIITLHSWNSSYEDYQLNLSSVQKLFYVKKIVERRVKF